MDLLMVVLLLAMAAVVVVLAIGISNFGKSGKAAAMKSNKMMRLRILFQFIAVVLIVIAVYVTRNGS